jgi:hypothetical protein
MALDIGSLAAGLVGMFFIRDRLSQFFFFFFFGAPIVESRSQSY